MSARGRGMALICSLEGRLLRVIRDEVGSAGLSEGRALGEVVAPGSEAKAERFLAAVREHGAVFDWELGLPVDSGRVLTLSFSGSLHQGEVLVIGGEILDDIFLLYEELTRVNNEEVNLLRRAIKERVLVTQRRGSEETELDDLSRLNSELVNLQRELAKSNGTLARLNEEKSTLLGMAAHDLRNPIASIQGHAALLLEVELDAEQRRRALESIGRVSRQMLVMVNDLLDVSVIESGRLELRRERSALHELLGQRVEFFRLLAARKSISIATRIGEVVTELDPQRIEQVIDNLLSNAVKYSPPGAAVDVSLALEGQDAVLAVQDRGPGLTEEDRRRLFGAFQRLSARPTGGEKSTGLGLAITQRIVTAHGGRVEVESAPGQGATFRVRLPLVSVPSLPGSAPPDGLSAGDAVARIRVLMVDDDEDIREAVQLALEGEAGFDLHTCASLEEALAELAHFTPDLLLLDVEMPGSDGPATLERLRLEPGANRTPAVFMTARTEPDRVARYRQLGALAVIEKPFDLPSLGGALRRALRRSSL